MVLGDNLKTFVRNSVTASSSTGQCFGKEPVDWAFKGLGSGPGRGGTSNIQLLLQIFLAFLSLFLLSSPLIMHML